VPFKVFMFWVWISKEIPDGADGFGSFSGSGGLVEEECSGEVVHHLGGGAVVESWG
jgi:hypothetical protein